MSDTYPHIIYVSGPNEQQVFVPADTPPDPPDPPSQDHAKLVITDQGIDYVFEPKDGQILQSYNDPQGHFTQRCLVFTDGPEDVLVWYRPDLDSNREEWIIEYGDPDEAPGNSLPYRAVVTDHAGQAHTFDLTTHNWFGRWRWQSEERPVRADYAHLASSGYLSHYEPEGLPVGPLLTVPAYTPMALCGLPANQGQTGAYPGIGPITGWQAQYLRRDADESSFRNHLEASGTYQWHIRQPDTLTPYDLINRYPNASLYGTAGNPDINKVGPTQPDAGHLPSIGYVAFLLTGDPYALEAMQFAANYMPLSNPPNSRLYVAGRYLAWPARAFGEIYMAMQNGHTYPDWLLPRSYWKAWLDRCRAEIEWRARDQTDPFYYLFHTVPEWGQASDLDPSKTGDHVWQQGFLCWVACWLARSLPEWVEAAEWLAGGEVARSSPTSGWARSHPAPYHLRMRCASVLAVELNATADTLVMQYRDTFRTGETVLIDSEQVRLDSSTDQLTWTVTRGMNGTAKVVHPAKRIVYGRKFTSWCEAKESNSLVYGWTDTNVDHPPEGFDPTYPSYMRAALAEALEAHLDVPGLRDSFDWVDGLIRGQTKMVYDNFCVSAPVASEPIIVREKPYWGSDLQHNPELADVFNDDYRGGTYDEGDQSGGTVDGQQGLDQA